MYFKSAQFLLKKCCILIQARVLDVNGEYFTLNNQRPTFPKLGLAKMGKHKTILEQQ